MAEVEVEADSEASEWENREREEHLAQMTEEEAGLGGRSRRTSCFPLSGWGHFPILFSCVRHQCR